MGYGKNREGGGGRGEEEEKESVESKILRGKPIRCRKEEEEEELYLRLETWHANVCRRREEEEEEEEALFAIRNTQACAN